MSAGEAGSNDQISAMQSGVSFDELVAIYALEGVSQFGPKKFYSVHEAGLSCSDVLNRPELLPGKGKRIEQLKVAIGENAERLFNEKHDFATRQLEAAKINESQILTYLHPDYPPNVYRSNNPIPILYARGNTKILAETRAVACVGSRKIREPYSRLHKRFVASACEKRFVVVSGFALGADTIGHEEAYENRGLTICVMPGGLQKAFPPENIDLWERLLEYHGAVFLTEFPFGSRASALTLRKRNKLIVACALGVVVSQSAAKGGAMNAFRFAVEQKKPVATFESELDSNVGPEDATSGNEHIRMSKKATATVFASNQTVDSGFYQWLSMLS